MDVRFKSILAARNMPGGQEVQEAGDRTGPLWICSALTLLTCTCPRDRADFPQHEARDLLTEGLLVRSRCPASLNLK